MRFLIQKIQKIMARGHSRSPGGDLRDDVLRWSRLLSSCDKAHKFRYVENWDSSGECMNLC